MRTLLGTGLNAVGLSFALVAVPAWMSAGCRAPEPEVAFNVQVEDWAGGQGQGKRILTDHWDIRTTVRDEEFTELLPEFMETSYRQYGKLFPNLKRIDEKPLLVYLFQSRREWDAFSAKLAPQKIRTYRRIRQGAFCEGDISVAYYIRRDRTLSVLAHEGLHAYVHRHFRGVLPPWLNEGLATYCESYEYGLSKPKFTPKRNEFRLNSLRDALLAKNLVPLKKLLRTHAGRMIRDASQGVYAYYAQAWSLIVFLRFGEDGKYSQRFEALLQDLGTERLRVGVGAYIATTRTQTGKPIKFGEAVFRKYFTEDLEHFEEEYTEYLYDLASLH